MSNFRFKNVCIESCAVNLPQTELSSAAVEDRLAEVYKRLGIPFGTLERLTGIENRYVWPLGTAPSDVATEASRSALAQTKFDIKDIGALVSCSVTRDYFEPATATLVHRNLGGDENSVVMDISNACVGFSSGIFFIGQLIEAGVIKSGIVTSGEVVTIIIESTMKKILENPNLTRDELLKMLPTFTLGCGSAAYVLCHSSISESKHRILGGTVRSATQFNDLCVGNVDYHLVNPGDRELPIMETESSKLIAAAAKLGNRTWADASETLGWSKNDVDHVFCHQVGRQVNEAFYAEMGLDFSKEYSIYRQYGNLVSAALPTAVTLGVEAKNIKKGERILTTGFGSGLNAVFLGIEW